MRIDEHLPIEAAALRFVEMVDTIAVQLPNWRAYLIIQMRKAALSVYLNVREGVGEHSPFEKARFYRMALRSLREAVGCLFVIIRLHPNLTVEAESVIAHATEIAPVIGRMARFHGRKESAR